MLQPSGLPGSEPPFTSRVHVVGAGPVGLLLTALLQSRDGISVHLYEKRREYTRTRMVQLASYLVADSLESYRSDRGRVPVTDMLDRYEQYIFKQWLRVYMRSRLIKHNKDLFETLDDPLALLAKLHIY
jgi:threonine dehydrogenase-like Zn-dependent dehydrogenase